MMERFGKSRYGCQTLMYRDMKMDLTPAASPSVVVLYQPQAGSWMVEEGMEWA